MTRVEPKARGDPTPVTGGRTPAGLLRDLPQTDVAAPAEALDRHILRLLSLHESAATKFKGVDLARMDVGAKRALLAQINDLLGVKSVPFPPE